MNNLEKNNKEYLYIKKWFDKWASIYNIITIPLLRIRNKIVVFTTTKNNLKILDVATGTGSQAFAFAKKGHNVVGIDFSKNMLKIANKKNRYKNVSFKLADATNIPFRDGYFDISCISFALHDMPLSVRKKVLKEMIRKTKSKGNIIIVDYALPNNKIAKFLIYNSIKFCEESSYYSEFIKSDLKTLLKKLGVKIDKEISILFGSGKILKLKCK